MGFAWPGLTHCEYCGRNLGSFSDCNCEESKKHREFIDNIFKEKVGMAMKVREPVLIEPPKFEHEPYITIPLEEYKELLVYKGRYLEMKE